MRESCLKIWTRLSIELTDVTDEDPIRILNIEEKIGDSDSFTFFEFFKTLEEFQNPHSITSFLIYILNIYRVAHLC